MRNTLIFIRPIAGVVSLLLATLLIASCTCRSVSAEPLADANLDSAAAWLNRNKGLDHPFLTQEYLTSDKRLVQKVLIHRLMHHNDRW